jgi:predicted TIM-barrel fold metal-dependent hydrolase
MSSAQEDIKVIDVMNYLWREEELRELATAEEPILSDMVANAIKQGTPPQTFVYNEEFIHSMDEIGCDKIFITGLKMYSHRNKRMLHDVNIDTVYEQTKNFPDRLIGVICYNPFKIEESVKDIERGVKDYGFKSVYFHSLGYGLPVNDRKLYPCYAKCNELGIPVSMQVGHSAEMMPSEPGRPVYLDEVALDFPNLTIVASHTGWPWVDELVAMVMKHPNVYCDISAWPPRGFPNWHPSLLRFMDTRNGREKTIFGTNCRGLQGLKQFKEEFLQLPLKEETKMKVGRENAIKIFNL